MGIDSKIDIVTTTESISSPDAEKLDGFAQHGVGDIYPIFALDDTAFNYRNLSWVMRFNDVLDANLLHASLVRLLSIGDWKKLTGRLRKNADGKLEAHVPSEAASDSQAVIFTHIQYDTSIETDPAAKTLPKPTSGPSIQPLTSRFGRFEARKGLEAKAKVDVDHDESQVSLHVTTFVDGTLVGLTLPHLSMDAIGIAGLLQNWSRVVNGKAEEVAPVASARADELLKIEAATEEKSEESWDLEPWKLRGKQLKRLVLRMLVELLFGSPKRKKAIFCPKDKIEKILQSARQEIADLHSDGAAPFVSETDILTGWITHLLVQSDPQRRPVTVAGALNARYRFSKLLSNGVHLQNMVGSTFTLLSPDQARSGVGKIALKHRECVKQQSSEAQFRAQLKVARHNAETKAKGLVFYGSADAIQIKVNSMIRVDLYGAVDFSGAVIGGDAKDATRTNPPGTMVFWYNKLRNVSIVPLDFFFIQGKDKAGNYWFMANLPKRAWRVVKKELAA